MSFFLTAKKLQGLLLISETAQNNHLFKDFIVSQESKRRIFGCEGLLTDKSYDKSRHVFLIPWTRSFQNNVSN